jgi:hypothetical protein
MARPRLTFACELDSDRLTAFYANGAVIEDSQALDARFALVLSDFSEARAAVVQRLNAAGVPVVAIPLMPYEDGYSFTVENAPRSGSRRVFVAFFGGPCGPALTPGTSSAVRPPWC